MNPADPTFARKMITFNASLNFTAPLPDGISVMNPFGENFLASRASEAFYIKFYNDFTPRNIILGINPGRFGAGLTGVPFTDPSHLAKFCGIHLEGWPKSRDEPSSRFVYEVVEACGGSQAFYRQWYINSICPLGFTIKSVKGEKNYNYYDNRALKDAALPFILQTLPQQLALGIKTEVCVCMGVGKNFEFLKKLNAEHKFFGQIVPIEHPAFVMRYQSGRIGEYVKKYVTLLKSI